MNQARRHFEETDLVRTLRQHWGDRIEDMEHLPLRDTAGEVICERIEVDPLSGIGKVLEEERAGIAVVPHIDDLPPPIRRTREGRPPRGLYASKAIELSSVYIDRKVSKSRLVTDRLARIGSVCRGGIVA